MRRIKIEMTIDEFEEYGRGRNKVQDDMWGGRKWE